MLSKYYDYPQALSQGLMSSVPRADTYEGDIVNLKIQEQPHRQG